MVYKLVTFQGIKVTLGDDFDFKSYMEQINKEGINSVVLGAISTLKNNIRFVYPEYEEGEVPKGVKHTIYLNSGIEPMIAYDESYNSVDVTNQYNERKKTFIVIGDTAIHRNEYSLVMPTPTEEVK